MKELVSAGFTLVFPCNCERRELLICKVRSFGLGCTWYNKLCTLTNQNRAYVPYRHRYILYFFFQYWSTTHQSPRSSNSNSNYAVFSMAERTGDAGAEEFFTRDAGADQFTRLSFGSLDLSTQVPNTDTATPQKLRRTEPQRSADLARKRVRYAQRTGGQRLMHDAHKRRTSNMLVLYSYYTGCNPCLAWCYQIFCAVTRAAEIHSSILYCFSLHLCVDWTFTLSSWTISNTEICP